MLMRKVYHFCFVPASFQRGLQFRRCIDALQPHVFCPLEAKKARAYVERKTLPSLAACGLAGAVFQYCFIVCCRAERRSVQQGMLSCKSISALWIVKCDNPKGEKVAQQNAYLCYSCRAAAARNLPAKENRERERGCFQISLENIFTSSSGWVGSPGETVPCT